MIPDSSSVDKACLAEIRAHGGRLKLEAIYEFVTNAFPQVTQADRQRTTPSGSNWWKGYIRFSLDRLKKRGQLVNPARGVWALTGENVGIGDSPPATSSSAGGQMEDGFHSIHIALPGGRTADIRVPVNITKADVERIQKVLSSLVQE